MVVIYVVEEIRNVAGRINMGEMSTLLSLSEEEISDRIFTSTKIPKVKSGEEKKETYIRESV